MEVYEKMESRPDEMAPGPSRPAAKLKFKDHDNLAHYANAAVDIQYEFPFGFKELEGIHSRTKLRFDEPPRTFGQKNSNILTPN